MTFDDTVERLRLGYSAFNAGDLETVTEYLDPDVSWERRASHPLAGNYEGRGAVMRDVLVAIQDQFDEFELTPVAFRAHGEHIIVTLHQRARGRLSGVPVEADLVHVWRIDGGRGRELRAFGTVEEALAALAA